MGEQIMFFHRPHKMVRDQRGAVIGRVVKKMVQRLAREPLTDDRGGLQCLLVCRCQAIHTRQHQAFNGGRYTLRVALLGVAQELFEKQGISLGTFDACHGDALAGIDKRARQRDRLGLAKRRKVDRHQWTTVNAVAPGLIERITFDAGGHEQHGWAIPNH